VITLEKKISIVDFKESLPDETTREVREDEKLCDTCGGFGIIYNKNRGVVKTCPDCFKGKIKVCKHCGKELKRSRYRCNCNEAKEEYEKERLKNALKRKEEAKEVGIDYIIENDLQLFDDVGKRYIPDIDDTLDIDWAFATHTITLDLNAYHILEDASVELHESARDSFDSEDYDKLQGVCDELNEKYKGYRSYYPDFSKWVDLSEYTK
jgi:predicted RNA-binding Zn-ribbon protein involved in translation (DUF1610 family)